MRPDSSVTGLVERKFLVLGGTSYLRKHLWLATPLVVMVGVALRTPPAIMTFVGAPQRLCR